jgi:transposase
VSDELADEVNAMLPSQICCVVGIDVAKAAHVVCALAAPSGAVRQRATRIEASAQGYAQLCGWLQQWGKPAELLIGLEATGVLWEPLYEAVTRAGYSVLVLNPRQTSSWAASLGLRAKTDGIDAHTLARGLLAGYARASVLPSEAVQSLRTLTRARRDLVQSQTAARQRLQDELVLLFPELPGHLPQHADLVDPALLTFLSQYSSAQAIARARLTDLITTLAEASGNRWGEAEAHALQHLAQHSAASRRAVHARALVVRTLALHLLDLRARLAELEAAIAQVGQDDEETGRLQEIPGIGPQNAATIRAELGDVSRFSSVDQVIAYAGLEPRTHDSGRFAGQKRLSKRGPGALRHALYLAALVAARFRPEWRHRYQRLLERGRAKKEALLILSRSLLKVVYHLLRTGASYDPTCVFPSERA